MQHKPILTYNQLLTWLSNTKGMVIVGLTCLTDARANKAHNPHWPISKLVRAIGYVGSHYETSVNREAVRQNQTPTFHAQSLPWGKWAIGGKVIEHDGQFYLRTQTTPNNRRKSPAKVLWYKNGQGKFLANQIARQYIPKPTESNKQQALTGIGPTVWVRTYAFRSIQTIRIMGKTYQLIPGT